MKVKPMIFNADMVKAILDGNKTVTRRPVKHEEGMQLVENKLVRITSSHPKKGAWGMFFKKNGIDDLPFHDLAVAPALPGDLIYVRETWQGPLFSPDLMDEYKLDSEKFESPDYCIYAASDKKQEFYDVDDNLVCRWRPSIHMPRWASRLTLKVTDIRIEQVQDISEEQSLKEGIISTEEYGYRAGEGDLFNCPKCDGFQVHGYIAAGGGVGECDCTTCDTAVKRFGILWDSIYQDWDKNPYVWVIEFEVINQNVDKYLASMGATS